jgi:hypothetical protein
MDFNNFLTSGADLVLVEPDSAACVLESIKTGKIEKIDKIELKTVFAITIEILIWSLNFQCHYFLMLFV